MNNIFRDIQNSLYMEKYPQLDHIKDQLIAIEKDFEYAIFNYKIENKLIDTWKNITNRITGGSDEIQNINLFTDLYKSFKNFLGIFGGLNNEEDFIYSIFSDYTTEQLKTPIDIYLSSSYKYTINYSNNNDLFLIPLLIFRLTRKAYRNILGYQQIQYNNSFIISESINNLKGFDSIAYLFSEEINICAYSIHYIMSEMGFNHTQIDLPSTWAGETLYKFIKLVTNIITKIIYSTISNIVSILVGINPFKFSIYTKNIYIELYKDKPNIANICYTCNSKQNLFQDIFNVPNIPTADVLFNKDILITINKNNFYWYDLFEQLDIKKTALSIIFNTKYIIQLENTVLLSELNSIFYIRQDMIFVDNKYIYIVLHGMIFARQEKNITQSVIPGEKNIEFDQTFINNLSSFYSIKSAYINIFKNGISKYDSNSFKLVTNAINIVFKYKEKTCLLISNQINNQLYKAMYIYLIYKHIYDGNNFEQIPVFAPNAKLELLMFLFAIKSFKQINIKFESFEINPNTPDIAILLDFIEKSCVEQFNNLNDKNDLNPMCRCLYKDGTVLSPFCFDQGCKTWIRNENSIYKEYNCKYPVCSQAINFTNLLSKSSNLNEINMSLDCGNFSSNDKIPSGKYFLQFQNNMFWNYNGDQVIISNKPHEFEIIEGKYNSFIKGIHVKNGYVYKNYKEKIPIAIGIINNKTYFINQITNSPFFTDGEFVMNKLVDVTGTNVNLTYTKVTN